MKNLFLDITKYVRTTLLLSVLVFSCSCSNDDDGVPFKGATLPITQGIAENVPLIQSIDKEDTYNLHEGIHITDVSFTYCTKPTRMIIAEIDLNKNVTLVTSTPDNNNSYGTKLQTVADQAIKAEEAGRKVLLAINGDYYGKAQNGSWYTIGYCYKDGVAIKTTKEDEANHVFYILKDGTAHISLIPEFQLVEDQVTNAVSGWQCLVEDGKTVGYFSVNDNSMLFHPRTFIGVSKDNKKVFLFVIDGRQSDYSNGMRLEDMMLLCKGAGCYQALNLDGGGSTTMVRRVENGQSLSFELMNKPSDNPARAVLNGIQVIEKNN